MTDGRLQSETKCVYLIPQAMAAPRGVHTMAATQGNASGERQKRKDVAESDLRFLKSMRI